MILANTYHNSLEARDSSISDQEPESQPQAQKKHKKDKHVKWSDGYDPSVPEVSIGLYIETNSSMAGEEEDDYDFPIPVTHSDAKKVSPKN